MGGAKPIGALELGKIKVSPRLLTGFIRYKLIYSL